MIISWKPNMHIKFKRKHLFEVAALTAVLTLNVSLFTFLKQNATEVSAYDTNELPTTIKLNDCSESEIRSYYSSLNSLDSSERKGTNLLKNLKTILSNGQKYYNYDSGDNVWRMYEITDRDWVKSPASAIQHGSYNSSTNTITNYVYGSNGDNPYIHALYVNREHTNHNTHAWGDHSQTNYGINREHIWAKSHGFQATGGAGARGDPMHLWAANGYANNKHSNYFFAFVDKDRSPENCESAYSYLKGNYKGNSKNLGGNQPVFEPQDCDKGDIARAVFYMVARYNNYAGESSGFSTNNPNLVLANDLSENGRTGTSTATDPYAMGVLSDLLAWNKLDPVDEYEMHRNNLLYRNFTNNRNPFIDFPSWADAIWGTANIDGTGYNSTITTYAKPATDAINSGSSVATFSISTNSVNLKVGDTAEIYGMNAEGNITWTISDSTVASLDKNSTSNNGKVTITALKKGTATITATNGDNSETCTVTVKDNVINYGSLEHPLTIAQAKQIVDDNNGELSEEKMYVKGIVSTNTAYNTKYSNYDNVWLQSEDGTTSNAFDLFRVKLDSSITEDFTDADSMQGYEVVAYGYAKKHNGTTYELSPNDSNAENPIILSAVIPTPVEKTAKEQIEEMNTATQLSYRYTKETTEGGATDVLNYDFVGITGNNYTGWNNKTGVSGVVYAGQSAGGDNNSGNAVQIRSKNSNSGIIVTENETGDTASQINVVWNSATASGRTLEIYGRDSAYTSPTELYDSSTQGTKIGSIIKGTSISLTITGDYEYIGIRSKDGAIYLDELRIDWGGASTTTYEYNTVSIRFGGLLTQELWNDLDTEDSIEGFGVMITTYEVLEGEDIQDFYDSAVPDEDNPDIGEEIVDYYIPVSQMNEKIGSDTNNYFWNLRYSITDFKQVYVAVAYILTDAGYVFFKQATYSVKLLADDYIKNRGYDASIAGGSLSNLANLK